jgi:hypothetical protein
VVQPRLDRANANTSCVGEPRRFRHDVICERYVDKPNRQAQVNARGCRYDNHTQHPASREYNVERHAQQSSGTSSCRRAQFIKNNTTCHDQFGHKTKRQHSGKTGTREVKVFRNLECSDRRITVKTSRKLWKRTL